MSGAIVVSPGNRRLTRLAGALHQRGLLSYYVSGYHPNPRHVALVQRLPLAGRLARRRLLQNGVPWERVRTAGVIEDAARALLWRLPRPAKDRLSPLEQRAMWRRNRRLAQKAAALVGTDDVVVAPYSNALDAFRRAKQVGAACLLDYPTAYHRYSRDLQAEEARLQPRFVSTQNFADWPPYVETMMDQEIALADLIAVGSTFARDSFVSYGVPAEKVVSAPYGVAVDSFRPADAPTDDCFRVLFVGMLSQRKGISYLLDAYAAFRKPDSELYLVGAMLGEPHVFAPYRQMFRWQPQLPFSEIPAVYRSASVFVLPSLIEGLGLVVLEAMASGVPVIVTPNTCGDDIVRDGVDGFIVPIRDAAAIASKLELLYGDQALRRRMGEQARLRAQMFTWDRYHDQKIGVIERLMGSKDAS